MHAKGLTPILNVSDLAQSFAWFEKLGWQKRWEWGEPPGFGAVGSGACEIFLCHDGQGGRGRGAIASTFGPGGSDAKDKGVWMSVWVGDVDEVHRRCLEGMTVGETLEETLLHSFEELGAGVASPHTPRTLRRIDELKEAHGLDYDCHASYRFVEG